MIGGTRRNLCSFRNENGRWILRKGSMSVSRTSKVSVQMSEFTVEESLRKELVDFITWVGGRRD